MFPVWTAMKEGGPWAVLLIAVVVFIVARARGLLVTKDELDRVERRMDKDTERVLELYKEQIKFLTKP